MSDSTANAEIHAKERFAFGRNWQTYTGKVNVTRLDAAKRSLAEKLQVSSLQGKSFLDIGSGSGLFSLAAVQLGAKSVHSFDFDPASVACAHHLKQRFTPTAKWTIEQGSALDKDYLLGLGTFDVVYSWGVLHHTGNMHQGLDYAAGMVAPAGKLFVAIYNEQPFVSGMWRAVKKFFIRAPQPVQWLMTGVFGAYFAFLGMAADVAGGRNPLLRYQSDSERGMDFWVDVVDWLGGYPFEVARPEAIFEFFKARGFVLEGLKTCGGRHGCNEFVFRRG